ATIATVQVSLICHLLTMFPSAQACSICPHRDIHRVHDELYRFESTRRSDQELFWTGRLADYSYRNSPVFTQAQLSEPLHKLRQHVSDELDHQAARRMQALDRHA